MKKVRRLQWGVLGLSLLSSPQAHALTIHSYPIVTDHRLALTRSYCRTHYGTDSSELKSPQVIVVHTTECATLITAENTFKPDTLDSERKYLHRFGEVNVGVHFLVDRNGDVYSLLPLNVIGRHTIGLNYTAIGIENVGFADRLTPKQLKANVELIQRLVSDCPSIRYLIGHQEYTQTDLPHYKLYREKVREYHPTEKSDPGPRAMEFIRDQLAMLSIHLEK